MVIFFESGRLGNQLFQYVALRSAFPKHEKIILVGFDSLRETFDGVDAIFINKKNWLINLLVKITRKLETLGWLDHLFNVGFESSSDFKITIKKNIPWLNLVYVKESYFQAENFLDKRVINCITFKPTIKNQLPIRFHANSSDLIFVQIRRGDYLFWPSDKYPAALDDKWYEEQIKYIEKKYSKPQIIFLTDDPIYVERNILPKLDSKKELVHISEAVDLYIMSICNGGILSPSSYSLWGVLLNSNYGTGIFIAPKYWIGHRNKLWFPSANIRFLNITYVHNGVIGD